MAIILLGKYEAYAPPFLYRTPPPIRESLIGGLVERVPFDQDLLQKLQDDWYNHHQKLVQGEWRLPSAHVQGLFYTVRKMMNGFTCTCPARGNCWHIKVAKELDAEEQNNREDTRRTEEEKYW